MDRSIEIALSQKKKTRMHSTANDEHAAANRRFKIFNGRAPKLKGRVASLLAPLGTVGPRWWAPADFLKMRNPSYVPLHAQIVENVRESLI